MSLYENAHWCTTFAHTERQNVARIPRQSGASMTEFVLVTPVLMLLGLGTLQAGLLQHARTTLNYATVEAARTGAVHHALPDPMRRELGIRLAPLYGGDGSIGMAAAAIARSSAAVVSPIDSAGHLVPPTRLRVLSPTAEAFAAWGRPSLEYADKRAIPNSHLRRQPDTVASGEAGMSLRDANVLTIEVTHAFEMKVPIVGAAVRELLILHDPQNAAYYRANRLPLKSVATVRMQSEAWNPALSIPPR